MSVCAVILAGGKGTRSADPTIPKIAQDIGGRTLMAWHFDLLGSSSATEILVIAGHLGRDVDELATNTPSHGKPVNVIHEAEQAGTVAALRLAAEHTDSDELLVVLGDILMSFPVDDFIEAWRSSGCTTAVAVHPSTHPFDSDIVFPDSTGRVIVRPKGVTGPALPNSSSAGLFAITRKGLSKYGHHADFGSHVLADAARHADLYAHVSSHYFKDAGTPDRLASARRDVELGAFSRRGRRTPRPAIFLDRDGVVNPAEPEVYRPEDFSLNPGVAEAIRDANGLGIPVLVVTNQPGLAKGFMTESTHQAIRARMDRLLADAGAFVDDYEYCPHHPETGHPGEVAELKVACACRKPSPGMLLDQASKHGVDLSGSVMVGDTWRDAEAAAGAGVRFIEVGPRTGVAAWQAIHQAIEVVAC